MHTIYFQGTHHAYNYRSGAVTVQTAPYKNSVSAMKSEMMSFVHRLKLADKSLVHRVTLVDESLVHRVTLVKSLVHRVTLVDVLSLD